MPGAIENLDVLKQLIGEVHLRADGLRLSIKDARAGAGEMRVEDEVILEKINGCLSQVGFLAIRKPRSNASSGTDPWDR
jgi:hypothetical protein